MKVVIEKLGRGRIDFWLDAIEATVILSDRSAMRDMLLIVLTTTYNQCLDDVLSDIPPQYVRILKIIESKKILE